MWRFIGLLVGWIELRGTWKRIAVGAMWGILGGLLCGAFPVPMAVVIAYRLLVDSEGFEGKLHGGAMFVGIVLCVPAGCIVGTVLGWIARPEVRQRVAIGAAIGGLGGTLFGAIAFPMAMRTYDNVLTALSTDFDPDLQPIRLDSELSVAGFLFGFPLGCIAGMFASLFVEWKRRRRQQVEVLGRQGDGAQEKVMA